MPALVRGLLVGLALPLAVVTAPRAEPAPGGEPSTEQIAASVQKVYDRAKTFKARFEQQFRLKAWAKTKDSAGSVVFAKPGKMSWRYPKSGNRVVSDGKTVKVYDAESGQLYEQPIERNQYPAALAFLVGAGKLGDSFDLTKLDPKKFRGFVLACVPKQASPAYRTMVLYVDAATRQVRRVILLDAQGNRNRFDFIDPRLNAKIPPGEFRFTPPRGTRIVR